jgi:hypothetical protein
MAKSTNNSCLSDLHKIKNKAQAQKFIEDYLKIFDRDKPDMPHEERMRIIKSNIGYCSGYYDGPTGSRILRLFDTVHPIFGGHRPSPETAFKMGVKMGEAMKKKLAKKKGE